MSLLVGYQPPGANLRRFLGSEAFARALIGPRQGGRKIAVCADILRRVSRASPARWRVVVGYAGGEDPMRAVGLAFAGQGRWQGAEGPFGLHLAERPLEFHFHRLDSPAGRRGFGRAEATIVWLAGGRDLDPEICDLALELAGSWRDGARLPRLVVTSRMPPRAHWLASRFVADDPRWRLFHQPGGRSPEAENLAHLPAGFYQDLAGQLPAAELASEIDADWRRDPDAAPQLDPRRLALAALWQFRGGFPEAAA